MNRASVALPAIHPLDGAPRAEKRYVHGTHRAVPPWETVARVQPFLRAAGITRVADVTGLDSIGIPVVMVCRPNARSVSVAQGKGVDLAAACASGVMESLEQWHAERIDRPLLLATAAEMVTRHRLVDCAGLPQLSIGSFHPEHRMLWIEARDLLDGGPRWVPFEVVHIDLTLPPPAGSGCFLTTTTGLASGNDRLEAVLHAIYEVIERDAVALWRAAGPERRRLTRVDPATVDDPLCRELLSRFDRAGVAVGLWDASSDVGVPVFVAEVVDREPQPYRALPVSGGHGCHLARGIALARALTEAAQTRLTWIAGSRDDIDVASYARGRAFQLSLAALMEIDRAPAPRSFGATPDPVSASFESDLEAVLTALHAAGLRQIAVVDLTRPELELPVVRVVLPGLESMSDAPGYAPGPRARSASAP